jgi:hypothetical protein
MRIVAWSGDGQLGVQGISSAFMWHHQGVYDSPPAAPTLGSVLVSLIPPVRGRSLANANRVSDQAR